MVLDYIIVVCEVQAMALQQNEAGMLRKGVF